MDISTLLNRVNEFVINPIIILLFSVALLVFFWGIFVFIKGAASEEVRKKGKSAMEWGIKGLLIMVGVYGILRVVLTTFGITPPGYLGF